MGYRYLPMLVVCSSFATSLLAQDSTDLKRILDRLDVLEAQNRELLQEVKALQQQVASAKVTPAAATGTPSPAETPSNAELADRIEIQEQRTAELDQTKVATDHKLPLSITGMVLANAFWSGKGSGGQDNPTIASANISQAAGGGTFRQTV